jgi:subfamily B ATP-binding cassette protein HlyB/CyaB
MRLAQLWTDFQQTGISVQRLGDILNTRTEMPTPHAQQDLATDPGPDRIRHITFRYRPDGPEVHAPGQPVDPPGEVIGIVGRSGSGKSTLTKLAQRLYVPESGRVLVDGIDLAMADAHVAAPSDRCGAAGEHAVQPHHPRQHRPGRPGPAPLPR